MGDVPSVPADPKDGRIRFANFEVDLSAGELRKSGVKIKLQGQPFAVLAMLLERSGDVVTREELQQKLWANDTYVDFEHGLNAVINKLRESLGDQADNPRYIETLPRRGYRFVASIVQPPGKQISGTIEQEEDKKQLLLRSRRMWWAVGFGFAGLCLLFAGSFHWIRYWTRPPRVLGYRQLTTGLRLRGEDSCGLVVSPLATDGVRVFFSTPNSPVSQVSASGGEVAKISSPFSCFAFSDISPDKTELLGFSQSNWTVADQPLWRLSIASGQALRVGTLIGHAAAWSPDGERIAYATGNYPTSQVFVVSKEGHDPRALAKFENGFVDSIHWSPNGTVLRMIVSDPVSSLWEVSAEGTGLHRLPLFSRAAEQVFQQSWTSDAKYSLLTVGRSGLRASDIWVLREARSPFGIGTAGPVQLTSGAVSFSYPTPSPDGKKIFAVGGQERGELVRYDLNSQRLQPFLSGISAEHLDFSRDGNWVTYVTFPTSILWRSKVDGSDRMQLTTAPLRATLPRWSPDGTRIAFAGRVPSGDWKIYVVSSEGGEPKVVSKGDAVEVDPTWSADGNSVIFGSFGSISSAKIYSVDLRTGGISVVPGSEGLYSPRVSPNGRFIVALDTPNNRKLMLFDWQTQKWNEILDGKVTNPGWPQWSADNRYIYLRGTTPGKAETYWRSLFRIEVATRELEHVAAVEIPEGTASVWGWMGVTPDGSPLQLRDRSIQEIYALDVDLP